MLRSLEEPLLDLGVRHRLLDLRLGHEVGPPSLQRRETVRVPLRLLVSRPLLGEGRLRLRDAGLRTLDCRPEEGRIDLQQEVPLLHVLPFLDREFDDPSGDIRGDVHMRLGFDVARRGDIVDEIPQPDGLHADFDGATPLPLRGEKSHGREKSNDDDRDDRFLHPVQGPLFRDSRGCLYDMGCLCDIRDTPRLESRPRVRPHRPLSFIPFLEKLSCTGPLLTLPGPPRLRPVRSSENRARAGRLCLPQRTAPDRCG